MPTIAPLAIARLAAARAAACDGVVAVTPHPIGVAATYGPGGRVPGVEVVLGPPGRVTVHIRAALGIDLGTAAGAVRSVVADALDDGDPERSPWVVDVHVADVDDGAVRAGHGSLGGRLR